MDKHVDRIGFGLILVSAIILAVMMSPFLVPFWCIGWLAEKLGVSIDQVPETVNWYPPPTTKPPMPPPPPPPPRK